MSLDLRVLPQPIHGPHTYAALLTRMSRNGIAGAVRRGDLIRVMPDLYSPAVHAESLVVRMRAAHMWGPAGSAITGRAALFQWGLVPDAPGSVGLVVPRDHHRTGPPWLWVVSQTQPYERLPLGQGVEVTSPELALVQAWAREPLRTRPSLVYGVCAAGLDPVRVLDLLARLPRVRRRRELARLLGFAAQRIESHLEEKAATDVFVGPEFDALVRQHVVRVGGRSFRLDAFDPRTHTAFECDGEQFHSDVLQVRRDRERDALLATCGIQTVRFSYADVMRRPQWCREVARGVMGLRAGDMSTDVPTGLDAGAE